MIGIDESEMINIMNRINWKEGIHSNATNASDINASSSLANFAKSDTTNDNPTIDDTQGNNANDHGSSEEMEDDYYNYDDDDYYYDYETSTDSSSGGSSSGSGSSNVETTVDE